jgi:hypothetical protein
MTAPPRDALYLKPGEPWRHASVSVLFRRVDYSHLGDVDVLANFRSASKVVDVVDRMLWNSPLPQEATRKKENAA